LRESAGANRAAMAAAKKRRRPIWTNGRSRSCDFNLHSLRIRPVDEEGALALGALMNPLGDCQTVFWKFGVGLAGISDLKAEMMQARPILRQPGFQRMIRRQRFDELKLGVAKVKMREAHGPILHHLTVKQLQPHSVAPDFERFLGIRYNDSQMVESREHTFVQ